MSEDSCSYGEQVPPAQLLRGLTVAKMENTSSDSFEVPAEELNPRYPVQ